MPFQISVQHAGISKDIDVAYRHIKEAGFDAVDCSIDHLWIASNVKKREIPAIIRNGNTEDFKEFFRPWKEASQKYGLDNYQSHAIFPGAYQPARDPEWEEFMIGILKMNIQMADYIGARNIVIHPFYLRYENMLSYREECDFNITQYSKLIPTAKEYGVTICLENMYYTEKNETREIKQRFSGCCGNPEQAVYLIDTLNEIAGEKVFGFCLDTGHTILGGQDVRRAMQILGDRIQCFHTHDNDGLKDAHVMPYAGIVDWDRFMQGLADIRFSKTLSFETFNIFQQAPYEVALRQLKEIANTGRMFSDRMDEIIKERENQ